MIKSRFYLIRGDNKPIYVGFTNRPIKQRFAEHKASKDFSQYENVTIEKLDELSYSFTWDEDVLYKNANKVSIREAQLVLEYGTQDSQYQKAIGGGVVWNYEKWFVKTNKNNPKFMGLSGEKIEEYIELENNRLMKLRSYISHTIPYYLIKQKIYIFGTIPKYFRKQKNYIALTELKYAEKQKNYIRSTKLKYFEKQKNYIKSTKNKCVTKKIYPLLPEQKKYIDRTIPHYLIKQRSYIKHTIPHYLIKQKSYIKDTTPRYLKKQQSYIGSTRKY